MPNHVDEIIEINCDISSTSELTGEIFNDMNISLDISPMLELSGEIGDVPELVGSFFLKPIIQINDIEIPKVIGGQIYDGAYIIIPSVNQQSLDTNKKVMTGDVIVEEIPTFWTQNTTGMTFIIGN